MSPPTPPHSQHANPNRPRNHCAPLVLGVSSRLTSLKRATCASGLLKAWLLGHGVIFGAHVKPLDASNLKPLLSVIVAYLRAQQGKLRGCVWRKSIDNQGVIVADFLFVHCNSQVDSNSKWSMFISQTWVPLGMPLMTRYTRAASLVRVDPTRPKW